MADDSSGGEIWALIVVIVLGYGAWKGGTAIYDAASRKAEASAPDPREEQIKKLNERIAQLESKATEHHYELRHEGLRTWRFDPATGDTCIQLTTKEDWKKPDSQRQSCQYEDFLAGSTAPNRFSQAECWFVGDQKACDRLIKENQ